MLSAGLDVVSSPVFTGGLRATWEPDEDLAQNQLLPESETTRE